MPLKDDAGQTRGYLKILRDMTEQRQLEEALEERTVELQHADRRKNEFLAMLAHELRNPLAAISSAVYLFGAGRGRRGDRIAWSKEVIERQVKNLARLVDDLLDISRVTQGKVQSPQRAGGTSGRSLPARSPSVRPHHRRPQARAFDLSSARARVPRGGPDPAGAGRGELAEQRRQVHGTRRAHRDRDRETGA